jgi:hypothetical protein
MFGVIVNCDYACANCESASGYQQSSPSLAALAILSSVRGLFAVGRKRPPYAYPTRNHVTLCGRNPSDRAPLWYRLALRPYTCSACPCLAKERRRQGAEGQHHGRMLALENDVHRTPTLGSESKSERRAAMDHLWLNVVLDIFRCTAHLARIKTPHETLVRLAAKHRDCRTQIVRAFAYGHIGI